MEQSLASSKFVVCYFCLVLLVGGLGYAPWVLASYGMFPSDLFFIFMLIGGASPTISALVVARLELGKKGPEVLFSQFGRKGFSKWWLVVPILLSFALALFGILLWTVAGGVYSVDFMKLAEFPPILISNFLMNMWEEIGWRGYALPALQRKHSALVSSLVVGVFWALWHWPHFAVKDSVMAVNYHSFLWFTIIVILGSITYTWLYNSTNGSLFIASLYHASGNAVKIILFAETGISSLVFPYYFLTVSAFAFILDFAFGTDTLCHKKKKVFLNQL